MSMSYLFLLISLLLSLLLLLIVFVFLMNNILDILTIQFHIVSFGESENCFSSKYGTVTNLNCIDMYLFQLLLYYSNCYLYLFSSYSNYHVFYQLCCGASPDERKKLALGPADSYFYLNQGKTKRTTSSLHFLPFIII